MRYNPVGTTERPAGRLSQHLVSPAFSPIVKAPPRDGKALLAELDAAGIRRAVVLSVGYSFADERKKLEDPDRLTREENDWTSSQVSTSGGRLIGFCSANSLRPQALDELSRCLALPGMRGIKLHLGNSGVSLRDSSHALVAKRVRQVGAAHVLYGSDLGPPGGSIKAGWEIFRTRVPLTVPEFRTIAGKVTRFARP